MPSPIPSQNQMPITWAERVATASYVVLNAIGVTSLFATALAYLITPVAAGGIGLVLGAAGLPVIAVVAFATLLMVIPLSYMAYRNMMSEAERLQIAIHDGEIDRKKNQDKLFFEMLRLRSLHATNSDFELAINNENNDDDKEVNRHELVILVNQIYAQLKDTKYAIEWNVKEKNPVIVKNDDYNRGRYFTELLKDFHVATNDYFRDELLTYIKKSYKSDVVGNDDLNKQETSFNEKLERCFKPIDKPRHVKRLNAGFYGLMQGIEIAGTVLGAVGTFGGMLLLAGFMAAIPVGGWIALGAACIAVGVVVGLEIGLCKQVNENRDAFNSEIIESNIRLKREKKDITNACFRQTIALNEMKIDRHEAEKVKKIPIEAVVSVDTQLAEKKLEARADINVNHGTNASLNRFGLMQKPTVTPQVEYENMIGGCIQEIGLRL